nr:hypothetical protein Iba_chr08eCG3420 [Ipomoea batatas]
MSGYQFLLGSGKSLRTLRLVSRQLLSGKSGRFILVQQDAGVLTLFALLEDVGLPISVGVWEEPEDIEAGVQATPVGEERFILVQQDAGVLTLFALLEDVGLPISVGVWEEPEDIEAGVQATPVGEEREDDAPPKNLSVALIVGVIGIVDNSLTQGHQGQNGVCRATTPAPGNI